MKDEKINTATVFAKKKKKQHMINQVVQTKKIKRTSSKTNIKKKKKQQKGEEDGEEETTKETDKNTNNGRKWETLKEKKKQ